MPLLTLFTTNPSIAVPTIWLFSKTMGEGPIIDGSIEIVVESPSVRATSAATAMRSASYSGPTHTKSLRVSRRAYGRRTVEKTLRRRRRNIRSELPSEKRLHGDWARTDSVPKLKNDFVDAFAVGRFEFLNQLISFDTAPGPIRKILVHLGEPLEPPPVSPVRLLPMSEAFAKEPLNIISSGQLRASAGSSNLSKPFF